MAIVTTGRSLEDIVFRQVDVRQILAWSYNLIRCNGDLSLIWEKVLFKNPILRDAKQVSPLWKLSFFDNSVKAVSIHIFKFISENITAVRQLTKSLYVVVRGCDNFRHTGGWAISCWVQSDNLVSHVDSWDRHHLTELTTTDDTNCFSWAHL